ncbi:MAG: KamA family radical SAM protein [Pseudomonadota bacterium]
MDKERFLIVAEQIITRFTLFGGRCPSFVQKEEESVPEEEPPGPSGAAGKKIESRPNRRCRSTHEKDDDSWRGLLARSVTDPVDLGRKLSIDPTTIHDVVRRYPLRINPYYLGLIKESNDPIWLQAVPDLRELHDPVGLEDPLKEEEQSPIPNIIHRYPDRVLFLVSSQCAMYCRFCTRKRKVGQSLTVTEETVASGIEYIGRHREVRDVLLSGGDPLLLPDRRIEWILRALRQIPHVEIIRIGTRVPCTLPQRITTRLVNMLKKYHPLYINTHFNHPLEITSEAAEACGRLADGGIPLGCQTVLLRGVNDDVATMKELMQGLLRIRVRPYYLYQADLTRGTAHFRTHIDKGIEIMEALRGYTSGLCVPTFVVDLPGGGGKTPILPNYLLGWEKDTLVLRNYKNNVYVYPFATADGGNGSGNSGTQEGNHEDRANL